MTKPPKPDLWISDDVKWVKATTSDNLRCPDCKEIMINVSDYQAFAFCISCKCYYKSDLNITKL